MFVDTWKLFATRETRSPRILIRAGDGAKWEVGWQEITWRGTPWDEDQGGDIPHLLAMDMVFPDKCGTPTLFRQTSDDEYRWIIDSGSVLLEWDDYLLSDSRVPNDVRRKADRRIWERVHATTWHQIESLPSASLSYQQSGCGRMSRITLNGGPINTPSTNHEAVHAAYRRRTDRLKG